MSLAVHQYTAWLCNFTQEKGGSRCDRSLPVGICLVPAIWLSILLLFLFLLFFLNCLDNVLDFVVVSLAEFTSSLHPPQNG
jgi:hypothetical protein